MSISFSNFVPEQCGHFVPSGNTASASGVNHESAPARLKRSETFLFTAGSFNACSQLRQRNTAIGTPQARWREIHQSGRPEIILAIRSSPQEGSHFTFLMSSRVRLRKVPPPFILASMEMNHCSVARKITGLWQRQQHG